MWVDFCFSSKFKHLIIIKWLLQHKLSHTSPLCIQSEDKHLITQNLNLQGVNAYWFLKIEHVTWLLSYCISNLNFLSLKFVNVKFVSYCCPFLDSKQDRVIFYFNFVTLCKKIHCHTQYSVDMRNCDSWCFLHLLMLCSGNVHIDLKSWSHLYTKVIY